MDITKSQSDFEAAIRNGLINYGLAKFESGEYVSESTRAMFMAFKTGRESIEVVLEDIDSFSPNDCGDDAVWLTELVRALRTAGIRIKGESE
ncbi:hypothetical protein [Yersinia aldovae]|uniref:hypothetical protein n=1 Tax=Yersinia aldovae TaxID=29483 RepID=UPI0011A42296|nr:hypothetical protein [Yersinia aldovae]